MFKVILFIFALTRAVGSYTAQRQSYLCSMWKGEKGEACGFMKNWGGKWNFRFIYRNKVETKELGDFQPCVVTPYKISDMPGLEERRCTLIHCSQDIE